MNEVVGENVYRLFYPSVPAIVAAYREGLVAAMPVVSILSVSNKPPRVAFSSLPTHRTYRTVIESGSFSVSWLDSRFVKSIEMLGASSREDTADKLRSAGLSHHRGGALDVPVIGEASAVLECAVAGVHHLGDHDLVVGDVKRAYAAEDFGDYWSYHGYRPIMYAGSPDSFRVYRG